MFKSNSTSYESNDLNLTLRKYDGNSPLNRNGDMHYECQMFRGKKGKMKKEGGGLETSGNWFKQERSSDLDSSPSLFIILILYLWKMSK